MMGGYSFGCGCGWCASSGEDGDDILVGGAGDDYLSGDSGIDTYIFNKGDGKDTIYDYSYSDESIRRIKGPQRPIVPQEMRAYRMLEAGLLKEIEELLKKGFESFFDIAAGHRLQGVYTLL